MILIKVKNHPTLQVSSKYLFAVAWVCLTPHGRRLCDCHHQIDARSVGILAGWNVILMCEDPLHLHLTVSLFYALQNVVKCYRKF